MSQSRDLKWSLKILQYIKRLHRSEENGLMWPEKRDSIFRFASKILYRACSTSQRLTKIWFFCRVTQRPARHGVNHPRGSRATPWNLLHRPMYVHIVFIIYAISINFVYNSRRVISRESILAAIFQRVTAINGEVLTSEISSNFCIEIVDKFKNNFLKTGSNTVRYYYFKRNDKY